MPPKLIAAPVLPLSDIPVLLSVTFPPKESLPPVWLETETEWPVLPVTLAPPKSRLPVPPLTSIPSPPAPEIATAVLLPTVASLTPARRCRCRSGSETLTPSTSASSARSIPSPPELVIAGFDPPAATRG